MKLKYKYCVLEFIVGIGGIALVLYIRYLFDHDVLTNVIALILTIIVFAITWPLEKKIRKKREKLEETV